MSALGRLEIARLGIDDTQRAEYCTVGGDQRCAGVEAVMRLLPHAQIVGYPGIARRIRNDQHLMGCQRVHTERFPSRGLLGVDPAPRFEPLPIGVDERDQCCRGRAQLGGQLGQVVEGRFGGCVEHGVRMERPKPAFLTGSRADTCAQRTNVLTSSTVTAGCGFRPASESIFLYAGPSREWACLGVMHPLSRCPRRPILESVQATAEGST